MIRLGKMTDYGIVLLSCFTRDPERTVFTARDLAEASRLPLPTVSKLLKTLSRQALLVSHRGVKGGYELAREPGRISVHDIIQALEGPVSVTECGTHSGGCEIETTCPVRGHWGKINSAIRDALSGLTLRDMGPGRPAGRSQL